MSASTFIACASPGEGTVSDTAAELSAGLEDEAKFSAWLEDELRASPASAAYPELMSLQGCGGAVLRWRRRYRGNAPLWKRVFKRDRVLKEIEECAPILDRALRWVSSRREGDPRVTVVDLCSGKGYLGMLLSEMLPPDKVERIVLVDKSWPTCGSEKALPHHINWDHIYGTTGDAEYFHTWPIRIVTSKQNIKKGRTLRAMASAIFERAEGPVMILAVHLCGTLSLRAVDLFNDNCDSASVLMLKPCCLPHAKKDEVFTIGGHSFPAEDVKGSGKYVPHSASQTRWKGPPRWQLRPRFDRWAGHLSQGIQPGAGGQKQLLRLSTDALQGYQNAYIVAERAPVDDAVSICQITSAEQGTVSVKDEDTESRTQGVGSD